MLKQVFLFHSDQRVYQLTFFHKLVNGKNQDLELSEDQIWPMLTECHEKKIDLKYFLLWSVPTFC